MRKILLYIVAGLFVAGGALAVSSTSWNSAWEAIPADSDSIANGADAIRDFKNENRERAETESCYGTGFTNSGVGCPTDASATGHVDTGRTRKGSARPFYQESAPTTLPVVDAQGSDALDNGRLLVRPDQGEPNSATDHDGGRVYVYDDGTENATLTDAGLGDNRFEPMIANGKIEHKVTSLATVSGSICVAGSWTSWGGGTQTAIAPASGNWRVHVRATVFLSQSTGSQGYRQGVRVVDSTGSLTIPTSVMSWDTDDNENGWTQEHVIEYSVAAVNSTTYTFDVECAASSASGGAETATVNATISLGGGNVTTTSRLETWLEPAPL